MLSLSNSPHHRRTSASFGLPPDFAAGQRPPPLSGCHYRSRTKTSASFGLPLSKPPGFPAEDLFLGRAVSKPAEDLSLLGAATVESDRIPPEDASNCFSGVLLTHLPASAGCFPTEDASNSSPMPSSLTSLHQSVSPHPFALNRHLRTLMFEIKMADYNVKEGWENFTVTRTFVPNAYLEERNMLNHTNSNGESAKEIGQYIFLEQESSSNATNNMDG